MKRREPYAKLYASWWCHPRTAPLSLAAGGLEARILSWSAHHGADGKIPKACIGQISGPASERERRAALAELVAAGVLTEVGDAYHVRDYLEANISKERDEARRANDVERQDRSRGAPKRPRVTRDKPPNPESVTRDKSTGHTTSLDHDHDQDHDHHDRRAIPRQVAPARADVAAAPSLIDPATEAEAEASEAGRWSRDCALVQARLTAAYAEAGIAPPMELRGIDDAKCVEIGRRLREQARLDREPFEAVLDATAIGFFRSKRPASKGYPLGFLASNPIEYARAGRGLVPQHPALGGGETLTEALEDLRSRS